MVKQKRIETNEQPHGPGKHAWCYYYKSEAKRLKEEGLKVTKEIKGHIGTNWKKMTLEQKVAFVNKYNKEFVKHEKWPPGLLRDPVDKVEEKDPDCRGISRCSVTRFSKMVSKFTVEQEEAVRQLGFGSLLGLRCGRVRQDLCRLLVKQCDVERGIITLNGTEYSLNVDTFTAIMGIEDGGSKFETYGDDKDIAELRVQYCTSKKGIPIAIVIERLSSITTADDEFSILFSLFAISTILCPTSAAYINPYYLHALKDVSSIRLKNWATWCLQFLWNGVKKVNENKTSSIRGCVLFLMIFYMSSSTYQLSSPTNGWPIMQWTAGEIKKFVQWEKTFGGFGSNAVPMRKDSGQKESFVRARDFDPVMTILQRIQDTIGENAKQTSQGMKLMENKVDQLTKKVDKLEEYLLELNSHVYREQARPTDEPTSVPNFEAAQPVDAKEVNAHDKKTATVSSSSLDDSFKLKQKFAEAFTESMANPQPCSNLLKDESSMDIVGHKAEAQDSDMSLIHNRPLRNRKPGPYQLSPYDLVSTGAMSKFKAGPFLVNKAVNTDHLKIIQYCFNKFAEKSDIIVRTSHEHITRGSLLSLLPGEPVQGEVICMKAEYLTIEESLKRTTEPINWFLPTTFAQMVLERNAQYDSFRRASQLKDHYMCDLKRCQQIFVPIHEGDFHWYMLLVKVKEKVCEIWDSLRSGRRARKRQNQVNIILQALDVIHRSYLMNTFPEPWSFLSFQVCNGIGVPTQPNGYDCGIYVITFMDTPGVATSTTYMHDSQEARVTIALQLIDSPLNDKRDEILKLAMGEYTTQQQQMSMQTPRGKPPKLSVRIEKNTKKNGRLRRKT